MVQKYQSPVRVYKYPFELVMAVSKCSALLLLQLLRAAASGQWEVGNAAWLAYLV